VVSTVLLVFSSSVLQDRNASCTFHYPEELRFIFCSVSLCGPDVTKGDPIYTTTYPGVLYSGYMTLYVVTYREELSRKQERKCKHLVLSVKKKKKKKR
jgi:hypothetical protein